MQALEKLRQWLALALTPGVGPVTMLKLIKHFGSAASVLEQNSRSLSSVVSSGVAKSITANNSLASVEEALAWQELDDNHFLLTLQDELYPVELASIAVPPVLLFAKGNLELLKKPRVALVGTRHPTPQGALNAQMFAQGLASNGICVVSGLAAGIDRHAHEGALSGAGSTIAVIGTGMDIVYPSSNKALYAAIAQRGLILSEFALGIKPLAQNFPRRNRIITGLSKACLVIESSIDGGSMISANYALEMGREVMAVPGSIHNQMARGCHKLLKQGAKLVETVEDVLEELPREADMLQLTAAPETNTDDPVLIAMGFDPVSLDDIMEKLDFEFAQLCGKLLELELSGRVVNCGGGRYQRVFK